MRALIFFIGFVCATVPSVEALTRADPEPLGASVFLLFLGATGAIVSPPPIGPISVLEMRGMGPIPRRVTPNTTPWGW